MKEWFAAFTALVVTFLVLVFLGKSFRGALRGGQSQSPAPASGPTPSGGVKVEFDLTEF